MLSYATKDDWKEIHLEYFVSVFSRKKNNTSLTWALPQENQPAGM